MLPIAAVDWQGVGNVLTALFAGVAAAFSGLTYLRDRHRLRVEIDGSLWYAFRQPELRITVAHNGNKPLSVRSIVLKSSQLGIERLSYDVARDDKHDSTVAMEPGQVRTFVDASSKVFMFDTCVVTLHDGSTWTKALNHDAAQAVAWLEYVKERVRKIGYKLGPSHSMLIVTDGTGKDHYVDLLTPFSRAEGIDYELLRGLGLVSSATVADEFRRWQKLLPELFYVEQKGKKVEAYWTDDAVEAARNPEKLAEMREWSALFDKQETQGAAALAAANEAPPIEEKEAQKVEGAAG